MKLSFLLTILCSIVLIACNGEARQPVLSNVTGKEPIDSFIKRRADSLYKAQGFPGMFIAVLDSNRRFYYSVGYADPDTKMVFDSLTQFEAGSITKTFTAFVLTSLLQEKKISDTSQISPWLPDSVRLNKQIASITFLQLLNHTSGLPRLPYNMDLKSNEMAPYDNYTEADLYGYLVKASPKTTGESKYSNLGMGLAGILAQKISGKSYEQLLTEYIYKPFALNAEGIPGSGSSSKSQGYFGNRKAVYWNMNCLAPCGNLKCNATELLNYLSHMSVSEPSSEAVLDKLLVPTATVEGAMKIGRGWFVIERDSLPHYYWHNGGTYGFSTFAGFLRGSNKAVVVVINEFNRNETSDAMGFAILRRLAL
jgi:CubicO group peptidase (beta-lactamase class C family)